MGCLSYSGSCSGRSKRKMSNGNLNIRRERWDTAGKLLGKRGDIGNND